MHGRACGRKESRQRTGHEKKATGSVVPGGDVEEEVELDVMGPGTGAKFISAVATQAHLLPMLPEIGEWLQSVKEIGHTLTRARIASV